MKSRVFALATLLALVLTFSIPAHAVTYSEVALGGGYECVLLIASQRRDFQWKGTVTLRTGNDQPWSSFWALNGAEKTGATSFDITLDPLTTAKFVLSGDAETRSGYLEILGKTGYSALDLSISFFYSYKGSGSGLLDSVGSPPSTASRKFSFPVERTKSVNTGLAYAPAGYTQPFKITLTLVDINGRGVAQKELTYSGHLAKFFTEIFTDAPIGDEFKGQILLEAEQNLYLTVLRLELTDNGFQLTSVPPYMPKSYTAYLQPNDPLVAHFTESAYKTATAKTSGFLKTGQDADLVLSAIGLDNSGGPLLFNHQNVPATDGTHLLVPDSNNNRVLIWNTLPRRNVEPDLVLGQPDFTHISSGTGRDQMNWPSQVSTDGRRVVVADTSNNRILIWNSFPTRSGTAADLVLQGIDRPRASKTEFSWPWGVWTDGQKLVVSSTAGGGVLIWNQFPSRDNQPADILLTGGGKMGTPREVSSNGRSLIIGDENPRIEGVGGATGSFFWKTFPTADEQPYDFFMVEPDGGPWPTGDFTRDGKLILIGTALRVWNSFPTDSQDTPDLTLSRIAIDLKTGDHKGVAVAGNRVFVSSGNENRIYVYDAVPTDQFQVPDFALGSPDIYTNTLRENFIITNPVPVSNGKSLFAISDLDRRLCVWKYLPNESGSQPDFFYDLPFQPRGIALSGNSLAVVGDNTVAIWSSLPAAGETPDLVLRDLIGTVRLNQVWGVAMDQKYFYLALRSDNKIYVWEGLPSATKNPSFSIALSNVGEMSSDGTYLALTIPDAQTVYLYAVATLSGSSTPTRLGGIPAVTFNLPKFAQVAGGSLFIADTGFHRVQIWKRVEDAIAGKGADVILGDSNSKAGMAKNKLFFPGHLSWDGNYLWLAEVKFSFRLLRFSPS